MKNMMQIGQTILGRHEVRDIEAYGSQAIFAKGIDSHTSSEVGIKQLAVPDEAKNFETEFKRFKRHAQIHIPHPNIVNPIDSGEQDGEWYIIMPFIEGPTLTQFIAAHGGKLPPENAAFIAIEIAKGLGACHDAGIIHRDIKPHNIILENGQFVRIVDFGIARIVNEPTITTHNGCLGTIPFLPPEQITDPINADHRADLYALGTLIYEMTTGQVPFRESDQKKIEQMICSTPPLSLRQLNPAVPVHIDQVCMRLLAKQPDARFQSAAEVIQALQGSPAIAVVNNQMNSCPSCSYQTTLEAKFCGHCGASLLPGEASIIKCIACGSGAENSSICLNCHKPFSPANHRIQFIKGALTGLIFRIPEGIYCVGRNELSPRVCQLSRRQFMISCNNGTVMVEDANSLNKTHINGLIAESPTLLANSQLISIGENIGTYISN